MYRQRVGKGQACYEKVRDAALDWEFQSSDGSMGLLEVPTSPPTTGSSAPQQYNNTQTIYTDIKIYCKTYR